MRFKFCFLFAFCLIIFLSPIDVVKAEEKSGYCICASSCMIIKYSTPDDIAKANITCAADPCKSGFTFKEDSKCDAQIPMHCVCKAGCVDTTFDNTMDGSKKMDATCAACGDNKFAVSGACPASPASGSESPSTPASPAKKGQDIVKLENPLAIGTSVPEIIGAIIKGILGVMGGLVLLMVVWGGTTWITAAGSPEKIKAGSQTILWALLGGILTVASYVILNNIVNQFF